jgi:iron(III) transport system substrate-binding protein
MPMISVGRRHGILCLALLVLLPAADGKTSAAGDERVVVYTALDREFSEPVLKAYTAKTGVTVLPKFDIESTKTVGLTQLIVAEAHRPRCDLFWNNEILNTLRLKQKGLLAPFKPSNAAAYPASFKAKDGTWYGFAARGRILLVNTKLVPEAERPASILALTNPKWKSKVGIAKPLYGTTATHATCLFAAWGDAKAKAYFKGLKDNGVNVYSGNKGVAQAVGTGEIAVGMTDTDDAMGEIAEGKPVAIVYPDRKPEELGTLFIPNTLALIKGAPHPAEAEALANYLLSPEVEAALARGPSVQIPLNPNVGEVPKIETPKTVHAMEVDWDATVKLWDRVAEYLAAEFAG